MTVNDTLELPPTPPKEVADLQLTIFLRGNGWDYGQNDGLSFVIDGCLEGEESYFAESGEFWPDDLCISYRDMPQTIAVATLFNDEVREALQGFSDDFPDELTEEACEELLANELYSVDAYFTLTGAGCGIDDRRWDHYFTFKHTDLKKYGPLRTANWDRVKSRFEHLTNLVNDYGCGIDAVIRDEAYSFVQAEYADEIKAFETANEE